jgi:hypothetical protein
VIRFTESTGLPVKGARRAKLKDRRAVQIVLAVLLWGLVIARLIALE